MPITPRVEALRRQSLKAVPSLSPERARLMTDYYRTHWGEESTAVFRAQGFAYLMEKRTIYIGVGELIVGEKGPAPKATPTYPELCCHSLQDLDILNAREKIPFAVSAETRELYQREIIPFWKPAPDSKKTMRDRLFAAMSPQWLAAYEAGVFTEFMEQRAPGHTVLDDKIYRRGMLDFIAQIDAAQAALDMARDPNGYTKFEELTGMRIAAQAIITFAQRHADLAQQMAAESTDPTRKAELEEIAAVCQHVPAHAPRTFREALQAYWFVHLGVTSELNTWDSFCPGRLDQHLLPFYEREIAAGTLTRDMAAELLHCFWIKFNNQPAPPKVGVTAAESGTYTDFAQINLGGVRVDGSDGVNAVSFLLLDVIEEMRLLQPSSSIQVSKKNPDRFIQRAARIIRSGFGQPSIFNADLIAQQLVRMGKRLEDARQGGSSGCVEVGAFGKEAYILTGYFNLPKMLELALHNGVDPRTGAQLGAQTGTADDLHNIEDVYAAFEAQMRHFIEIKVRGNSIIEQLYAQHLPAPFLSLLTDDCIARGMDYHAGGARYNTSYIQGVGIGTITDSLSAIATHVDERGTCTLRELVEALDGDFSGAEHLRLALSNHTPRYGNDDDRADDWMRRVFESYYSAVDGRPNLRGGQYHINMLPTTCHVYFGAVMIASPDGRHAGKPLSEGISPVQGADRCGPTSALRSAAKMDHARTGGTLLNQKFTPALLQGEAGLSHLTHLVRTYFAMDGHHIQFNVVDAETLREAQRHPQQHRDLIVRVAGYSDYFCDLSEALQEEIIQRTAHGR